MFIRFERIQERDEQTDRQMDTAQRYRPRLCIASRSKNQLVSTHCMSVTDRQTDITFAAFITLAYCVSCGKSRHDSDAVKSIN